jgi:hypothetical protein
LNQEVNFYEIRQKRHLTEGDFEAILFNPVTSTIPKWLTFKLTRNLQQSGVGGEGDRDTFYADRPSKDGQIFI